MIVYYLYVNNKQEGPFTWDELKVLALHPEILIWYDGLDNWQEAGQIAHLKSMFSAIPPTAMNPPTPVNKNLITSLCQQQTTPKIKNWVFILVSLVVILLVAGGLFTYQHYKQQAIQKQIDALHTKINQHHPADTMRHKPKPVLIELE